MLIERWANSEPGQRSKMERFGKILNIYEGSKYVSGLKYVRVLNICKFSWIWQGSEYASGCSYRRVLDIPGSEYARFLRMQALHKVLNIPGQRFTRFELSPSVLNMFGLRIWLSICLWKGCEYLRVTQGAEYAWISLSMP